MIRALLWAFAAAAFLRFGLETTGWLFYEAHFATGLDWLYWGYSVFRGAGYALGLWGYQDALCAGIGLVVALLVLWRQRSREVRV